MQCTFQFIFECAMGTSIDLLMDNMVHSNFHYVLPKLWLRQVTIYVGITSHSYNTTTTSDISGDSPRRRRRVYSKHIARIHLVQFFSLRSATQ
jgi:hypothetical protein